MAIGIPLLKSAETSKEADLCGKINMYLESIPKVKHRRMRRNSTRSTVGTERPSQSPRKISRCSVFGAVTHARTHACTQPGQFTPVRKYRCFFSKHYRPQRFCQLLLSLPTLPQIIAYGYQRIVKLFFLPTLINSSQLHLWN